MAVREIPLVGDVSEGLVRVGATVRRPMRPSSPSVHALLRHLEAAGFDRAPRFLGIDERGRAILTYIEGMVPARPLPAYAVSEAALTALALLLRRLHDAAASFGAPPGATWEDGSEPEGSPELVGHCDVTPANVVFRDRPGAGPVPYALIDFDMARPTTRLFDVVTTLRHWAPLADPVDRDPAQRSLDAAARVRLFCDAYGLPAHDRLRLVETARTRFGRSYELMRDRARTQGGGWARMWADGAGGRIRRAAAWLDANEEALQDHLLGDAGIPGPVAESAS
ncbi:phosphotransferase [Microbispora triticiradicis]|uniref:Phosphotransferase n=2 Tax=Microbispora TaxID=2005 RepID=A0ABY3M3K4_9ACTN|nr:MULTISPECIES: phosphotransferase [Microbispora]TLP56234.1 aminoglycoside phosphotransferase family protein [Microbispora fusca]TYB65604.1 phosphotransferase [Microbispora tritici]